MPHSVPSRKNDYSPSSVDSDSVFQLLISDPMNLVRFSSTVVVVVVVVVSVEHPKTNAIGNIKKMIDCRGFIKSTSAFVESHYN